LGHFARCAALLFSLFALLTSRIFRLSHLDRFTSSILLLILVYFTPLQMTPPLSIVQTVRKGFLLIFPPSHRLLTSRKSSSKLSFPGGKEQPHYA
jgi:hypothetical protein